MGGERFESPQPGEYLFGENEDLNFLGNKPVPFPYPVPTGNEPTKTLKSLVYIRKDTLRLVKAIATEKVPLDHEESNTLYNIEFVFDSDVRCTIRIHYFAIEEVIGGQIVYHPKSAAMSSEGFHYKRGAAQLFSQPTHTINPSKFSDEEWQYSFEKEIFPIVIHCLVEEEEHAGHSHIMYAVIEKSPEGSYLIKPLKQKQFVDGLCYLLQEIYGIENKNMERMKHIDPDEDVEDSGAECVICMSDMRDTLILPCRHLCLCSMCAESLRYQASMCPICRVKFRALLQIRAMRKKIPVTGQQQVNVSCMKHWQDDCKNETDENPVSQEGVPPGFEAISLVEALNGQVVPQNGQMEGVTHPIGVPTPLFTMDKKGHKETKISLSTSIEYQKEMDPAAVIEKKNNEKDEGKEEQGDDVAITTPLSDVDLTQIVPDVVDRRRSPEKRVLEEDCAVVGQDLPPDIQVTHCRANNKKSVEELPSPGWKAGCQGCKGEISCQLTAGDMADDEREDSSETEPEPDYDEDEAEDESYTLSDPRGMMSSELSVVSGTLSEQTNPEEMEVLQSSEHLILSDTPGSGTESSSFGSNCSSHALLTQGEGEDQRKMAV
ncbi:hypothetical protein C0Q70_00824 [Pomacea canaliculata]|uniref:RING-type E3 ubiquitin transferase n=1 Tax=Pomacea canaliculata TaxID=400727 RepID=A0A2T7PXR0_POMCA|nr:hypothetical protein C0Q70_00824 [Pomacea canaliculata]